MLPCVKSLHYIVEHDPSIDYSRAEPLCRQEPSFDVSVEDEKVCFTMKQHHPTEAEALDAVSAYIAAWEFEAGLKHGLNKFHLRFEYADIEDRNPNTGKVYLRARPIRVHVTMGAAQATVGEPYYPSPPTTAVTLSPDVRSMYDRYLGYREGREPLPSMAYFCLTVLEMPRRFRGGARKKAAKHYRIDKTVLDQLGKLSSTKGGVGARKEEGIHLEFTPEERCFLEETVKAIIRRAAEVAHDPNSCLQHITMSNLPTI